jgi:hypothetical protein
MASSGVAMILVPKGSIPQSNGALTQP